MKLDPSFYLRNNVLKIARELLGKVIVTDIEGERCSGIITETEAYAGIDDKASHAFGGRRTARTEIMYRVGGTAYVYRCYGIHDLFNVVSNRAEIPHAVLIRAIHPLEGIRIMEQRRKKKLESSGFSSGPGTLSQALGISLKHTGLSLHENTIWIEDRNIRIPGKMVEITGRIGVEYAGEDAALPYRFLIRKKELASLLL
ncbi:MAG: DNA-3-methyladenine glycosylase [Bacteroidia bacterium]|nr:DNA-3-methyladenine glycosylase [Bacteroidia bacterium]